MTGFAELMWVRVPTAVHRFTRTLGLVLADGAYLRAWPTVAVTVPAAGLLLGVALGSLYGAITGEALYAASLLAVALMAVVANVGAGVGFATWAGFVAADIAFTDRGSLPGFDPYLTSGFLSDAKRGYLPLAMAYLLLFGLLVLAPLAARALAARAEAVAGRSMKDLAIPAGGGVSILVTAGLAYAWAQGLPILIRPLWTFSGETPDPDVLRPLQDHPVLLAVIAGSAAAGRLVLSAFATTRLDGRPEPIEPRERKEWAVLAVRIAGVLFQAAVITVLLAGLITEVSRGLVFGLFILGILAIRLLVIPLIPGYARVVRRAPLLLRLLVCAGAAYALSRYAVEPLLVRGDRSMTILIAVVASLFIATLFLPGPPVWVRTPAAPGATGAADFGDFGDLGGRAGRRGRHSAPETSDGFGAPDAPDGREAAGDRDDAGGRDDAPKPKSRRSGRTVPEPREPVDAPLPPPPPPPPSRTRSLPEPADFPEFDFPEPTIGRRNPDRWTPDPSPYPDPSPRTDPEPVRDREPTPSRSRRSAPEPAPSLSPAPEKTAPEKTPSETTEPKRGRDAKSKRGREPKQPPEPREPRKSRRSKPEDDDLAGWPGLLKRAVAAVAGGLVLITASPAYAESCTRLADDCTLTGKIAPMATGITVVLLMIVILPEILSSGVENPFEPSIPPPPPLSPPPSSSAVSTPSSSEKREAPETPKLDPGSYATY